jgi:hypothetical protein
LLTDSKLEDDEFERELQKSERLAIYKLGDRVMFAHRVLGIGKTFSIC